MAVFKPGDRVRRRGMDWKGTVLPPFQSSVHVQWDLGRAAYIHPECLIKLRPKMKAREWWVNIYDSGHYASYAAPSKSDANAQQAPGRSECVHVREVFPRKAR